MPKGIYKRKSLSKRFSEKVAKTNQCWNWNGFIGRNGYGTIQINKKPVLVHRLSYELYIGKIKRGLQIDHLCRNRRCVNPKHLEPVTAKINVLRGIGLAAINSRKSECKRGHKFNSKNTRLYNGQRICRICSYQKVKRWRKEKALKKN